MKNFFFILALCCLGSIGAIAQSTTKVVTGAVIDKNGNPLPGAIVEATGGAESTVVDADGTFSIEVPIWLKSLTTRYAGMKSKKKNLNGRDMIFLLRPDTDSWFINLETSVNADVYRIGVMGGYLGKWGGYAKLLPTGGCYIGGVPALTVGVIKHIKSPVYSYLGLGYAPVGGIDSYPYSEDWDYEHGAMFEAGLIFNIKKKINISTGYSFSSSFCCYDNHEFHFGVGYCF